MPRFHPFFTKSASKGLARMRKRGKNFSRFEEVIAVLEEGERLDPRFRPHPLKGDQIGKYECHIEPDWLLIYHYEGERLVLVDMGTHAELFGM